MRKLFVLIIIAIGLFACNAPQQGDSQLYNEQIEILNNLDESLGIALNEIKHGRMVIDQAQELISGLEILKPDSKLANTELQRIQTKIEEIRGKYLAELKKSFALNEISLLKNSEYLFEDRICDFHYCFIKNDSIKINLEFDRKIKQVDIVGEKTERIVFSKKNLSSINTTIQIPNSDAYTIMITTSEMTYGDVYIGKIPCDLTSKYSSLNFTTDTIPTTKTDKYGKKAIVADLIPIFNEPYKVTLNSHGKSFFSGEPKVTVPLKLPENTKYWVYRFRVSYGEEDVSKDNTFVKDVKSYYTKKKLFGINFWESEGTRSSLVRELLNNIYQPATEEAYCNFFLIKEEANAKKFVGGQQFDYDIKASVKNLQSRNGMIEDISDREIFIGFENSNFTKAVYVWIEVVALTEVTEYYKIIRKPMDFEQ